MFPIAMFGSCLRLARQEQLGALSDAHDAVLARLLQQRTAGRLAGAVLIDTCNRFEVIAELGAGEHPADLADLVLPHTADLPIRTLSGGDAVLHALRVATGLESLIVGEDQIIGQIRRAFQDAEDAGLLSRRLHMLWTRLLHAARTLRNSRPPASGPRSVAELAAAVAREAGPAVALIGAGSTGRLAAAELMRLGVGELFVFNRTLARAHTLAEHCGGHAGTLDDLRATPPAVDAVVLAVAGGTLTLPHERMPRLRAVVDISHPSVLPTALRLRSDLLVLDLDGLAAQSRAMASALTAWVEQTRELAAGHAERICDELASDRASFGRLVDLHVENAQAEVERARRGRLRDLDDAQLLEVRALVERIARRNAHLHLKDLRRLTTP